MRFFAVNRRATLNCPSHFSCRLEKLGRRVMVRYLAPGVNIKYRRKFMSVGCDVGGTIPECH